MKVGLFDHMQKNDKPERSYAAMYANHLEILEHADAAAMDFYFVAEHHFDLGFSECPSPGTFLGAASQRTKQIHLGPLVYVLPLWHPIRVAEEVALLDNLSNGRIECGFGAGIGPFAFSAYGVSWENKRKMAWEGLNMIKGIWTNPSFSFDGEFYRCENVELGIPLVQKPHPPLWMPTRSAESIAEAASTGVSTVQWVPPKMPTIRAAFDHYREVYQGAKPAGTQPHIGLMREIYVGETDEQARQTAEPHWRYFWERRGGERTYGGHGQGVKTALNGGRMQELLNLDQSLDDGSFICGSPDTVARQILQIAHQAGADTFLGEFTFGALEHKQASDSLDRFIKHVLPILKAEQIDALNYPRAEAKP